MDYEGLYFNNILKLKTLQNFSEHHFKEYIYFTNENIRVQ